uniref:DUF659 domain-containing protein n=1 Tax=Schizaphis graminum TaxID=13262 RepID=A0A2S2P7R5_SCHGA
MTEHPLWIDFFKSIRPAYKLPTRKVLSTTQLDKLYRQMQNNIRDDIDEAKNLHLQLDGWTNINNVGIINFIVSKPEPLFVKFVNTQDYRHTGEYLKEQIINVLEEYGKEKFFVLIGDNAANIKKAFELVKKECEIIQPLGCAAHGLHLLCFDIIQCSNIQEFMQTAASVVKTIKRSQVLSAVFKKYQLIKKINIQLKLPVKTRWGSYLYCLDSLNKNKSVLQSLSVDETVTTMLYKNIKTTLLNDETFWPNVLKLINLLTPIVDAIVSLESNNTQIHKVRSIINTVENKVNLNISNTLISVSEEVGILSKIAKRKEFILGKIHIAAELLDPNTQGKELSNQELVDGLEYICDLGSKMNENVSIELANYQSKDGIFSKKFIWDKDNMQDIKPLQFWKMLYNITPLSKIALKILSAPCTSAATERSFSTFSWIHNKKRNRLTTERAGKLTYLSYNWKIKCCEPKSKYSNKIHSVSDNEDSMSVRAETNEVVSSECGSITSESDTEIESEIPYADSDSCEEEKSSSVESGM